MQASVTEPKPTMSLCDNRTVLITGAGGGLGRAYALAFAGQGARVVVNDIRLEAARAVVDEIRAAGGQGLANGGDITTLAGSQGIVDAAVAAFGEVHVLVNNAGVLRDRMFLSSDEFSPWSNEFTVSQEVINQFAALTGDDY